MGYLQKREEYRLGAERALHPRTKRIRRTIWGVVDRCSPLHEDCSSFAEGFMAVDVQACGDDPELDAYHANWTGRHRWRLETRF
jgi:hypothetical protein